MNKKLIILLLLFFFSDLSFSQSIFETIFPTTSQSGQNNTMTEITGSVVNLDCCTTTKFIQQVTYFDMPSDWLWSQCTPDFCLQTGDSLGHFYLGPADTGQVSLRFYIGNISGMGEVNIRFYDRDNLNDFQDVFFNVWYGTSNITKASNLLIFPNPVRKTIYIEGDIMGYKYQLKNILGTNIKSSLSLTNRIDFSDVPKGTYFLLLEKDNEKIVKQILVN